MGDYLKKVQPGQALNIPAATYNAFVDAANAERRRRADQGGEASPRFLQNCIVQVQNTSGAARDRFAVLGVDGPLFTPTDSLDEFAARFALKGVTPSATTHKGRFVILAGPADVNEITQAYIAGVCPVQIDVTDDAHTFAEVTNGDAAKLTSGASGSAVILWKESGIGTKWAIVRIGTAGTAPADTTVVVKITGAGSTAMYGSEYPEGGKYLGRILTGVSTATGTGNLAMPEAMTVPDADNALVINTTEDGNGFTWALAEGSYYVGKIIGQDDSDGLIIVAISVGGGGLPAGGSQYQVLQRNATGDAVWDWVRAH